MHRQVQQSRQLQGVPVRAAATNGDLTTLIDKRGASPLAQAALGHHAHNVTMTALTIALAKHFVTGCERHEVEAFLSYFAQQSQRMAAQAAVSGIEGAAEQKTPELAAMLLDKHIEAQREHDRE